MTSTGGLSVPSGSLGIKVLRGGKFTLTKEDVEFCGSPDMVPVGSEVWDWRRENYPHVRKQFRRIAAAQLLGIPTFFGQLYGKVIRADGQVLDLGLMSLRVVTDTGVAFIVDAFQGTVEPEIMKYHGIGTGVTAEAQTQSALVTELTTEYIVNGTRATGTLAEFAANIFQTVGVNTVDAPVALREHGVFSIPTVGGVMIDRSLFAAVNLEANDSIQTDYRLTFAAGG